MRRPEVVAPYGHTVSVIVENGWICTPQARHSRPPGTPGGVEDPLVVRDYGQEVVDTMLAAGFVPKATSGNLLNGYVGDRPLAVPTPSQPGAARGRAQCSFR